MYADIIHETGNIGLNSERPFRLSITVFIEVLPIREFPFAIQIAISSTYRGSLNRAGDLAYNLGNFTRTLGMPNMAEAWSLASLRKKLSKIGAKDVSHGRYVTFHMAEVLASQQMFA